MRCTFSMQILAGMHPKGALQWSLCSEHLGSHKQRWSGSLVRIDGCFNASSYCGIMDDVLLPYVYDGQSKDGCFLLQHDHSPTLKAGCVVQLLDDREVPQLEWPLNEADLNPTENVWGLIKSHQACNIANATADALWESVKERVEAPPGMHRCGGHPL